MIIRSKRRKRFEVEIGGEYTLVRYAKSLRGVLWHLSHVNGRVSLLDRKTDVPFFLGSPRQGYNLIKTLLDDYGGNEDIVMDIFASHLKV
jgi:hypothetical protein